MLSESNILALAYQRYIQQKPRNEPTEMFKKIYPTEINTPQYSAYLKLCDDMDNNDSLKIMEELKSCVKNEGYKRLIYETTKEILKLSMPDEYKHKWIDIYTLIEAKMIEHGCRETTIKDKKAKLTLLFKLANTDYIEDINIYKANEIKIKLFKLPKNVKMYKTDVNDLLKMNIKKQMSLTTINSYLIAISQLYEVANNENLYNENPFKNLKIKKSKQQIKDLTENRYMPFSSKELKKIFNPETYPTPDKVEDFYIPIISLCQGMRANEICQLTVNDIIKSAKNQYAFVIHEDEKFNKKTKNQTSNRIIPVSPILEKLGFIDYIKQRKRKDRNGKLFKNCNLDCRGYFSKYISVTFKKYLDKLSIIDKTKVFHSFRHNFRINCAKHKFSSEVSNSLGGWSSKCVGESYANKFEYKDLWKAIKQIDVPELRPLITLYGKTINKAI